MANVLIQLPNAALLMTASEYENSQNMTVAELVSSEFAAKFVDRMPNFTEHMVYVPGAPTFIKQLDQYWVEADPRTFKWHNTYAVKLTGRDADAVLYIGPNGQLSGDRIDFEEPDQHCRLIWMSFIDHYIVALDDEGDWWVHNYDDGRDNEYDDWDIRYLREEALFFWVWEGKKHSCCPSIATIWLTGWSSSAQGSN
jgi:hypothetical protein